MTDYCEVGDILEHMPDTTFAPEYENTFRLLITRASRLIDRATARPDGAFYASADSVRYFDGSGQREQWIGELAAAPTTVQVDEGGAGTYTTWAGTDYILWPYNAAADGKPYTRLDVDQLNGDKAVWYRFPRSVKITGKWGYSVAVPEEVKQAVIIQTVRWFKRAQQAYQDVGAIVELGQLRFVRQIDPDVEFIVNHLRRVTI